MILGVTFPTCGSTYSFSAYLRSQMPVFRNLAESCYLLPNTEPCVQESNLLAIVGGILLWESHYSHMQALKGVVTHIERKQCGVYAYVQYLIRGDGCYCSYIPLEIPSQQPYIYFEKHAFPHFLEGTPHV